MSGDQLNADVQQYLQAAGLNVTPPSITSDPLVTGGVPIEQLLRILGIAANAGDPQDNAESLELHAERDAITTAAAEQFSAQDENAAAEVSALTPDSSQLAQQVPQLASGIAGALAGALGGALQPLTQMPQQLAQAEALVEQGQTLAWLFCEGRVQGLLSVAQRHRMQPYLLDLRNSGDTAGDKERVVGYASFAFCEAA